MGQSRGQKKQPKLNRAQRRQAARKQARSNQNNLQNIRLAGELNKHCQNLLHTGFILGGMSGRFAEMSRRGEEPGQKTEQEAKAMIFLAEVWERSPAVIPEFLVPLLSQVSQELQQIQVEEEAPADADPSAD